MTRNKKLILYATTFNNASTVRASLDSVSRLGAQEIYIVDNYSSDGTFEELLKYGERNKNLRIVLLKIRSTRGWGRHVALEHALRHAKENDLLMYVDLDTIYRNPYIKEIRRLAKILRGNQVCYLGHLAYAKTQRKAQWKDLNQCEDWERISHFKRLGFVLVDLELTKIGMSRNKLDNKWFENSSSAGETVYRRESRYTKNKVRFAIRLVNYLADEQRGLAYKSFSDFYGQYKRKNPAYLVVFIAAFVLARLKGVYEYDKRLNNKEYVLGTRR